MAIRQTRSISLPPHQDAFVERLVALGHYRTASEVIRHGLRLLEEAEHRRLLEEWICQGLSEEEMNRIPPELTARARAYFQELVGTALREVDTGSLVDGPAAISARAIDRILDPEAFGL